MDLRASAKNVVDLGRRSQGLPIARCGASRLVVLFWLCGLLLMPDAVHAGEEPIGPAIGISAPPISGETPQPDLPPLPNLSPDSSNDNDRNEPPAIEPSGSSGQRPTRRGWFGLPPLEELLDDTVEDESTYFPDAGEDPRQPNIRIPGPDTANFPNSPYTIRQGRFYLEVSPLILSGPSNHSAPMYNAEALFRFGLTNRTEFRIFTNGLTAFRRYHRKPGSIGFAPLAFDFKTNFFKQNDRYWIPAVGMETFLQTNTGSVGFNQNAQVGINLLMDHSLPYDFLFEWNVGIASDPDLRNTAIFEFVLQWALQKELFEGFDVFYHGYLNGSPIPRAGDGLVMGGGAIWAPSRRFAFWGSYNFGTTPDSPTTLVQLGTAVAF